MTELDTGSDVDIVWEQGGATARIPLAGDVTPAWCDRYSGLASSKNVPATAESHPGRAWIIVTLPASRESSDVQAAMDAATALIAEADTAGEPPPAAETEAAIREWWARQRG